MIPRFEEVQADMTGVWAQLVRYGKTPTNMVGVRMQYENTTAEMRLSSYDNPLIEQVLGFPIDAHVGALRWPLLLGMSQPDASGCKVLVLLWLDTVEEGRRLFSDPERAFVRIAGGILVHELAHCGEKVGSAGTAAHAGHPKVYSNHPAEITANFAQWRYVLSVSREDIQDMKKSGKSKRQVLNLFAQETMPATWPFLKDKKKFEAAFDKVW